MQGYTDLEMKKEVYVEMLMDACAECLQYEIKNEVTDEEFFKNSRLLWEYQRKIRYITDSEDELFKKSKELADKMKVYIIRRNLFK